MTPPENLEDHLPDDSRKSLTIVAIRRTEAYAYADERPEEPSADWQCEYMDDELDRLATEHVVSLVHTHLKKHGSAHSATSCPPHSRAMCKYQPLFKILLDYV